MTTIQELKDWILDIAKNNVTIQIQPLIGMIRSLEKTIKNYPTEFAECEDELNDFKKKILGCGLP